MTCEQTLSWQQFYDAIYDNDVRTIKTALYCLHTRAFTTTLEASRTCLEIATKLGHKQMVDLMLNSQAFQQLDPAYKSSLVTRTFLEACDQGNHTMVKTACDYNQLLKQQGSTPNTVGMWCMENSNLENGVVMLTRVGAWQIARDLFQKLPSSRTKHKVVQKCISTAYTEGYDLSEMRKEEEFRKQIEHEMTVKTMFDADKIDNEDLSRRDYHSGISCIEYAAVCGRTESLLALRERSGLAIYAELWENAMDLVVEKGLTNICTMMIIREWVNVNMSPRWERRLISATENNRNEIVILLLCYFVQPELEQRKQEAEVVHTEPEKKKKGILKLFCRKTKKAEVLEDPLLTLLDTLLKTACGNNNGTLVETILEYIVELPDHEKEITESFNIAVRLGLPLIARIFHGKGYKADVCRGNDCYHASVANANPVVSELLWGTCPCWEPDKRSKLLETTINYMSRSVMDYNDALNHFQWLYLMSNTSSKPQIVAAGQNEIFRLVLRKLKYVYSSESPTTGSESSRKLTRKNGNKCIKSFFTDTYTRLMRDLNSKPSSSLLTGWYDFMDISREQSLDIFNFRHSNLYDVCRILRVLCGCSLRCLIIEGSGYHINGLSMEKQELFIKCAQESGLEIWDRIDGGDKILVTPFTEPTSLQSHARLAVRRAVRTATPVGSLDDQITTFYQTGILPPKMIDFLLFRHDPLPLDLAKILFRNT